MARKLAPEALPGYVPPDQRKCMYCGKAMRPIVKWDRIPDDDPRPVGANVYRTPFGYREAATRIMYFGCGYLYACESIQEASS